MFSTTKDNKTTSPARTCGVQFRAANKGERDARAAWERLSEWHDGLAGLDEHRLPRRGRKRVAGVATALRPGESWLDYGGHEVPGLSKNP